MKKPFLTFLFSVLIVPCLFGEPIVKEPNVSGAFYPAAPQELSSMLESFFLAASEPSTDKKIKLIIAPHAGYVYSGAVAANSYKAVSKQNYSTIILIGPSHYFDFPGISIWSEGRFKTPLGDIDVDQEFAKKILERDPQFQFLPHVFEQEHSLEVQMPFLQKTFKDFKIVPVLMGRPNYEVCQKLSLALTELLKDRDDVLIVISTDMSHYHPAQEAQAMDAQTIATVKSVAPENLWRQCILRKMELCGFTSVVTGLLFARQNHLEHVDVLKYDHSGTNSGDMNRVVGYMSVVFSEGKKEVSSAPSTFSMEQKKRLIAIARESIETFIKTGETFKTPEPDERLTRSEGTFVTIRKHGELRGCIGQVIGNQPLYLTVRDMGIASATQDPRFPKVTLDELKDLEVEVSVLSVPHPIANVDEIKLGEHGVIVRKGNSGGLFLPQVATETGWSKEEFLSQLCSQKAGLSPDCWRDSSVGFAVFTAEVFSEKDVK